MSSRTVVVGGSVGGVRVAQALRSEGYSGEIVILDAESHAPYDKPPLSKGFLDDSLGVDRLQLISSKDLEDLRIDLRLGSAATGVDISRQLVLLSDDASIHYDNLIVATGVRARPSPWGMPEGVHLLRTLDDSLGLRNELEHAKSIVVIGAGFIGAEVAATARKFGLEVSIVDPLDVPMGRVLGEVVGRRLIELHHMNDVSTHFGTGVEAIRGSRGDLLVKLSSGEEIRGEAAVIGIGAVPNVEWLESSGLMLDNGLVCDEYCRAAGQSNVYGVGDVARWYHSVQDRLVRVEHWTNAVEQAVCVAKNIVHPSDLVRYSPVPYVWSDQYDWKIQIAGETASVGSCSVVEDPSNPNRFAAVYSDYQGFYCGVATVNWPRAMIQCRRLLGGEKDPSVPVSLLQKMVSA